MEPEMRDYVVSFVCDFDDYDYNHHIHFVTEYPVNSAGWWEDFYDTVLDLVNYHFNDGFNLRIVDITEGF